MLVDASRLGLKSSYNSDSKPAEQRVLPQQPMFTLAMQQGSSAVPEAAADLGRYRRPVEALQADSPVLQYQSLPASGRQSYKDQAWFKAVSNLDSRALRADPNGNNMRLGERLQDSRAHGHHETIDIAHTSARADMQMKRLADAEASEKYASYMVEYSTNKGYFHAQRNQQQAAEQTMDVAKRMVTQGMDSLPPREQDIFKQDKSTSDLLLYNQQLGERQRMLEHLREKAHIKHLAIQGITPNDWELLSLVGEDREGRSHAEHQQHLLIGKPLSNTSTEAILNQQDALRPLSSSPGQLKQVLTEVARRNGEQPVMS